MANYPIDVAASGQPVQWSAAGGTSPLESILNNRLLLQYLSAAGQDIGAGRPIGTNVNAVTQQNIAAQSYSKLLQKLLAQGGKVTMDGQNVSIKAPTGAFKDSGQPNAPSITEPYTGQKLTQPTGQQTPSVSSSNNLLSQLLIGGPTENPTASSLGNLTGADLAGLRPEDISQALQFKFAQDTEQRRDALATMRDSIEREKLALEYAKLNKGDDTADIRNYQYAVKQGYTGSFEEFRNSTDTAGIKEYERAKAEGYQGTFQQWKFELAERSRSQINIGDKVDQARAMEEVKQDSYFSSPTGLQKDLDAFVADRAWLSSLSKDPKALSKMKFDFIYDRVVSKYGPKNVEMGWTDSGRSTLAVRVTRKDGTKETYHYVVNR